MVEKIVLLDAAAFVDWLGAAGRDVGVSAALARTVAQRFLSCCYDDLGKAPRLLDAEELGTCLCELLPRHFGVKEELAAAVPAVLAAYLDFLGDTAVVPAMFELRSALDGHLDAFLAAVAHGTAHADGVAITGPSEPFVHRASKTGRNDPCPCGSGKKFKKCCGR